MTTADIAKRKRAVKIATAINSIEGVNIPEKVQEIQNQWANGIITSTQMKQDIIALYKRS